VLLVEDERPLMLLAEEMAGSPRLRAGGLHSAVRRSGMNSEPTPSRFDGGGARLSDAGDDGQPTSRSICAPLPGRHPGHPS